METLIKRFLPKAKRRGRKRTDSRLVLNAILYVVKSGCPWRLVPSQSFPPWKTVYHHFRAWSGDGTWAALNDRLRALSRASVGKRCRHTAAIPDSQTERSDAHGRLVGYDAAKKTKGP